MSRFWVSVTLVRAKMRVAAILGLGSSTHDLRRFQQVRSVEWTVGLPVPSDRPDAVLIFGGDGTVHRHLSSIVRLGVPVLIVPAGSGNDLARALGLHSVKDSLTAWNRFSAGGGQVRAIDLGLITPIGPVTKSLAKIPLSEDVATPPLKALPDTNLPQPGPSGSSAEVAEPSIRGSDSSGARLLYFSCAAGVGLDGEIARRANALPRWLRAHGGYALSLPGALAQLRSFRIRLSASADQGRAGLLLRSDEPVILAVFANTPVYGGGMRIAPTAQMDDGQLDVCLIRDISKLKLLGLFPTVYFGRHLGIREVEYFTAATARVETERPLEVYADGERACSTPVEISTARQVLQVIVP